MSEKLKKMSRKKQQKQQKQQKKKGENEEEEEGGGGVMRLRVEIEEGWQSERKEVILEKERGKKKKKIFL